MDETTPPPPAPPPNTSNQTHTVEQMLAGWQQTSWAFPHNITAGPDATGRVATCHTSGMTLRDYFAGQALIGILMRGPIQAEYAAREAFNVADWMMSRGL